MYMIGFRVLGIGVSAFPKIRGAIFSGIPIIRIRVFWGLYWGPPIWAGYHVSTWDRKTQNTPSSNISQPGFPLNPKSLNP